MAASSVYPLSSSRYNNKIKYGKNAANKKIKQNYLKPVPRFNARKIPIRQSENQNETSYKKVKSDDTFLKRENNEVDGSFKQEKNETEDSKKQIKCNNDNLPKQENETENQQENFKKEIVTGENTPGNLSENVHIKSYDKIKDKSLLKVEQNVECLESVSFPNNKEDIKKQGSGKDSNKSKEAININKCNEELHSIQKNVLPFGKEITIKQIHDLINSIQKREEEEFKNKPEIISETPKSVSPKLDYVMAEKVFKFLHFDKFEDSPCYQSALHAKRIIVSASITVFDEVVEFYSHIFSCTKPRCHKLCDLFKALGNHYKHCRHHCAVKHLLARLIALHVDKCDNEQCLIPNCKQMKRTRIQNAQIQNQHQVPQAVKI